MKTILMILVVIAGVVGLILGIEYYLTPKDELSKADVIIAISGGDTRARAQTAIELYDQGYAPKILFSGAALDPSSPSNAQTMKKQAVEAGVAEKAILLEESSQNTAQNAERSESVLDSSNYTSVILVTSPYHQRRAYLEFADKLGADVEIINFSSPDQHWPDRWYATPRGWWLGLSESVKTAITAAKNLR